MCVCVCVCVCVCIVLGKGWIGSRDFCRPMTTIMDSRNRFRPGFPTNWNLAGWAGYFYSIWKYLYCIFLPMFHSQIPPSFYFPPVFSFLASFFTRCSLLSFIATPCSLVVTHCSRLAHYSLLPVASQWLHDIYCLPLHHSEVCILSLFFSFSLFSLFFSFIESFFFEDCSWEACMTKWNAFSFIPTKIYNRIRTKQLEWLVTYVCPIWTYWKP